MKYQCIVIDDEQLARQLLESYILKMPYLELVAKCRTALEAMEVLQENTIDLMFLDIQMPELTGIEFLKTLKEKPAVIFTTAYSEHALEGYQLDVIDYLVKPFDFERFMLAVNKAIDLIRLKNKASNRMLTTKEDDFISVHADYKIYKIKLTDIEYIEGLKEYVSYYTKEKRIVALESLKRLEEILPSNRFMRVHRSYIIPLEKVKFIEGNQVEISNKKIPIGRSYKEEVLRRIFGKEDI